MVSPLTTIAIDSHLLSALDNLCEAKKTAQMATTPIHLNPDITAWLNRARHSYDNRCDVSRDARAE